ncbi:tandem-95 repeat protein [Ancylomarina sp. 16SWW S1-10-2]|uniref:tandem-95 repeat protein n=1 Tax=Ancylomarina sp. 16SWW S1-10-2 TaxID=2499681 RepID=UPI0012AE8F52|nr:tandem-95 repeat protein [Ancylomarina sp. 16SWW S1-10-2]MRT93188.1 tandem-95 repeat protein [Ancylomarina sp. 16SWW S1-10-2]
MKKNILFKFERNNLLKRLFLFLVLVVLTSFGVNAQDAAFTFTLSNQCGSGTANFNQTSVAGVTNWDWDFGNGNSLTTAVATEGQNPSATYASPGIYTVSLSVNGGTAVTQDITIYPNPEPDFTVLAASGCEPMDVTLTGSGGNVTVAGFTVDGKAVAGVTGGDIDSYQWSFLGKIDGVTKTDPVLSLSGLIADTYGVLLILTDDKGCTASTYKPAVVTVNPTPTADFSITKENDCGVGDVTFGALATISSGEIDEYQWDVLNDDNIEAVSESYTHNFSSTGTFDVALTVKSDEGCLSNKVIKQVKFNSDNTTDFSFSGNCVGQEVTFTAVSSDPTTAWSWDFGDGTASSLQNPTKTFSTAGDKTVTLTATHSDGCVMVITKTVTLSSVEASFNYDLNSACPPTYKVAFTGSSSASTNTWSWNFDGKGTSTEQSPDFDFLNPGTHTVTLTVTSGEGCVDTYIEDITIVEKTLDFTISSPAEGCEGLGVGFTGSYSDATNDPVTDWNWTFENESETGIGQNANHTYNTRGVYDVSLSIETTNGCMLTETKTNAVQVGQKPVITNITAPDGDCANVGLGFITDFTGLADSLHWDFSNGGMQTSKFIDGLSPQSISHEFTDDSDFHSLTVTAFDNGCSSDPETISNIVIKQPIANFSASEKVICSVPSTVNFTNTSESDDAGTIYEWDFDDGSSSTDQAPSHTYVTAGDYTVTLTVTNPTTLCSDVKTQKINVTTSSPNFVTDKTVACHPAKISFTNEIIANSSANFSIKKVEWDFDSNGTIDSSEENPSYTYIRPDSYAVSMTVTEENGCEYNIKKDGFLSINGPVASFTEAPVEACLGDEITFTNTTTKYSSDPATSNTYSWNFGDGDISIIENPTHTYGSENVFEVSLLVTDDNGCSNTFTETNSVIVPNLVAGFTTTRDIYCLENNIEFTNTASITNGTASITKYEWDLDGDGSYEINTTSNGNQALTFASSGTYTVKQRISSSLGCTDEFIKEITIVNGDGTFTPDDTNLGCAPASTTFRANDDDTMVASYAWTFGDGEMSTVRNPLHFYVYPGSYDVTLTVVLTGGCTKTSTQTVTVAGAVGNFTYNNLTGCADPDHIVKFEVSDMSSVNSLTWDFGKGVTEKVDFNTTTDYASVDHAYTTNGTKRPFLTLTDNTCGDYAYYRDDLGRINTSIPPTVDFSKSTTAAVGICENVEFQFFDESTLNDDRYQITGWAWDFGDGKVSNLQNPNHQFTTAGTYDVELEVTTSIGCTTTLKKTGFVVVVSPNNLTGLAIDIIEPGLVNSKFCSSDNVIFNGSATTTNGDGSIANWVWNFGDGNDASTQSANHTYNTSDEGLTNTVTLTVTDNSQCVQVITKDVSIYKVEADFSITNSPVLRGNNIAFADLSTSKINSATDGTISDWAWTFEEGTPTSSVVQNPNIAYNTIGSNYDVGLTVTNNEGCIANTSKTVSVSNNPPLVTNFGVSGNEDTDIAIAQANFNSNFNTSLDPSQTITKVKIISLPENGDLYIGTSKISAIGTELTYAELATLIFKPEANWNGTSSFDYNASDGLDYAVNDATITITVNEIQDVPVVTNINLSNDKDVNTTFDAATFEAKFSDVDLAGNTNPDFKNIKITDISDLLLKGSLTLNGVTILLGVDISKADIAKLVFEPLLGFVGTASFEWNGSDGADYAVDDATVSITYINTKPILTSVDLGDTKEDEVMTFPMSYFLDYHSDVNVNDDPFTRLKIISLPPSTAGVFKLNQTVPLNLTVGMEIPYEALLELEFTPASGYNGVIELEWDTFDGTEYSEGPATISFTYVNTAPTVSNITKTAVNEDTQVDFTTTNFTDNFNDVDIHDNLTRITIKTLPANGTLKLNGVIVTDEQNISLVDLDALKYFPNPDFNGTDSFKWRGNDGTINSSNVATVNLTIKPIQDKPTVSNITKLEIEDTPVPILAQDFIDEFSDVDAPYGNPNGTLVEIIIKSLPTNGTLELNGVAVFNKQVILVGDIDTGSGLVFVPNDGYEGDSSFDWNASDGLENATTDASVNIKHTNTPPVVTSYDFGTKLEDAIFTLTRDDFQTYYSDDDATDVQFKHVKIVSLPSSTVGVFTIDISGTDEILTTGIYSYSNLLAGLKFTPKLGANGIVNLIWNAEDGTEYAASNATFSLTYINSIPVVTNFAKPAVDEDNNVIFSQADFDSNYLDVDVNDSMEKIKITDLPDKGTLKYGAITVSLGDEIAYADLANLIYEPNANYFGPDSFTWQGFDGTVYSSNSEVSLSILSVNDIPTADNETVTELEDVTYIFTSSDFSSYSDVETGFAGIKITDLESQGTLEYDGAPVASGLEIATVDISKLKFIPKANENGPNYDSFTFQVFDGEAYSASSYTMTIDITAVNDEPTFSLKADSDIEVDEDSGAAVVNGQLINISEGLGDESAQTITVLTSNNNNNLFSVQPSIDVSGNLRFTPADNMYGTTTVSVYITDDGGTLNNGDDQSISQTFTITVNAVNDPPVAKYDSFSTNEDVLLSGNLKSDNGSGLDSDLDSDSANFTYSVLDGGTAAINGTISLNADGTFSYDPNPDFFGTVSFTYQVCDDAISPLVRECDIATVSIAVNDVNDAPIALDNNAITKEDIPIVIPVLANDSDVDGTLDLTSLNVVIEPSHGTVSTNLTTGELIYTPDADYHGNDEFTYEICDNDGACDTAVVYIVVQSENDKLVANDDTAETDEDVSVEISVLTNDVDLDGTIDSGSLVIVGQAANGTLVIDNTTGIVNYTPNENFYGVDSFTYEVCDNQGACDFATVTVTVNDANDAPIALDNNAITKEDVPAVIDALANDSDEDGTLDLTSLKIIVGQEPVHGSVSINPTTGEFTYTPNTDYHGNDEFTYEICDDDGACDTAVVYIVVQSENDKLVANNDTAETDEDVPVDISVLTNDVDLDGTIDVGSLVIVGQAANGTLAVDNTTGIVSYTPNENFYGVDSFTYEVCDDQGACDFATVSITVNDVNDAPIALDNNAIVNEDEEVVINVLANDSDVDGTLNFTSLNVVTGQEPAHGTVSINPTTGEIIYTPDADYYGNDEFTYEICDDDGDCDTAKVNITVNSVNDILIVNDDSASILEDTPVTLDVLGNDVDSDGTIDISSLTIVNQPTNGVVAINPVTGEITYTPDADFYGTDTFVYRVCDNEGSCDTASVSITVNGVNDAPIALDNNAITKEDIPIVIPVLANDSDVDGTLDLTSLQVVSGPGNGTVSINPTTGEITYTPEADYHGNDEFTYQICDDDGACTTAVVYLVVQSENDTLVATNDTAETAEDTPVDIPVLTNDVDLDGTIDPGSLVIVGQASNGTLVVDNVTGIVSYTPNENFQGTDSFTYEVCDDQGACDFATVSITVNDVNDAPIALDNNAITNEDVPAVIDVLANDSDVDGTLDLTSLQVVSGPSNGTVSINPTTGEITYTPEADYHGNDEFTYQICDEDGACTTAVVYVVVKSENDTLVANNDTAETDEDTPVDIPVLTNDVDLDGNIDFGTLVIVGQPANGTLIVDNTTGIVSYTPNENFNGVDSFTYEVCDDQGACDFATVSITVNDVNDAPIALDNNATTKEDESQVIDVLANDSDVDGTLDLTSLQVVSGPSNGTVNINPTTGEITYTPEADYHGNDEFTYQICDEDGACTTAVVYLVVQSENDTLVATNDTAETDEDTPVDIPVLTNDVDLDGNIDFGTLVIVGQAANGTLVVDITTGIVSYTPNENFHGVDSFTYEVCDDQGACDFATVTVTVNDVNDAPIALDNNATTKEDESQVINVLANDSDVDGTLDLTSLKVVTEPEHGTVSINSTTGEITYTPNADYHGNDQFTYEICDDDGACDIAVVYIVVQSENDKLVANNDTAVTDEDSPVNILVLTNDEDSDGTIDPGTLIIVGQAANGTLKVDNITGIVSYTPNENFHGVDSFTYEVCDDQGACDFATVTVTVNNVNDAPVALDNNAITKEDESQVIDVLANDSDVDGTLDLTNLEVVTEPAHGTVIINPTTGEITYTPDADYHGNDQFTYEICDNDGACDTAVVYIIVQSENDKLVANNDMAETEENIPVDIAVLTNDEDSDGTIDPESLVIVGQAANGTLVVDNATGIVSYTPNENFHGVDSFIYEVCDDDGACDFATVTVTVKDVNDAPVALDNNALTKEDESQVINVLANDSDVDGTLDLTSLKVVTEPEHGTVSINPTTGEITYTPDADYHGNDQFTYEICDNDGACDTAVVYIIVQSENDKLVANNDTAETEENIPVDIAVLTNDEDSDGTIDPGSLVIVGQPANGTLVVDNATGIVSYTPNVNFHGVDSFIYEVCDDQGACDFATVTITVGDVNSPPVALNNNVVTNEDVPVVIDALANDSDVDGTLDLTSLKIVAGQAPAHGTVSINPTTGEITYTPNADYHGNDEFIYQICDDDGDCATAVVYIEVVEVNDHMNAVDDTNTTEEDSPVTTQVLLNDTDIEGTVDPTSLSIYSSPSHGTVVVNTDGTITYTPESGFNGVDTYEYQVCDDGGFCDIATVSITVSSIDDDVPVALDDTYITPEDVAIFMDILANDSDLDNDLDPTTVSIITDPLHGVVTVNPVTGQLYYIPNPNYHGTDEILYQVCDELGHCTTAKVSIIVNEQYDLPVANDDEETTPENVAIQIEVLANDWDVDDNIDFSTLAIVNQPKNGTVTIDPETGIITYTPNEGFNGLDLFSYNICDNNDHCDQATVSVIVTPVNDPPVAVDDYVETFDNTETTIRVLINDEDPDGDDLTVSINEEPLHGTVIVESYGSITYKADLGYYCNTDSFVYSICDPYGLCDTAEVMIEIDPLDSDQDRIPDAIEGLWVDQDADGVPNFMDTDSDNDGISDLVESQIIDSCIDLPVDTDGDGIPDYLDVDSDNDGYSDKEEGADDCDDDGIVNYLDAYDDCSEYVSAPEGFSPNGDGVNDFFVIKGIKDFPNSVLRIFNRWGAKIYSKKGYQNDWDGRADNSLTVGSEVIPEGTYYYVLDLKNGSKALKGFIYINY